MADELNEELKKIKIGIAGKLKNAVLDFTTLEVTTLSGEVKHIMDGNSKKFLTTENILKKIKTTAEGEVDLIAHTQIHFDHDTINFVKAGMKESEKELFMLHQDAIRSANEGRNGFLGLLQKIIV
jgi:hypothetical protein